MPDTSPAAAIAYSGITPFTGSPVPISQSSLAFDTSAAGARPVATVAPDTSPAGAKVISGISFDVAAVAVARSISVFSPDVSPAAAKAVSGLTLNTMAALPIGSIPVIPGSSDHLLDEAGNTLTDENGAQFLNT